MFLLCAEDCAGQPRDTKEPEDITSALRMPTELKNRTNEKNKCVASDYIYPMCLLMAPLGSYGEK